MKSTPLLVSTPLIQPILDEIKTQTRRILLNRKAGGVWTPLYQPTLRDDGLWSDSHCEPFACPFGTIGDQLWVREEHYQYGHWEICPGEKTPTGRQKWKFVQDTDDTLYYPPPTFRRSMPRVHPEISAWYKRLGRFMPKKCSRITLEITDIRVERVQSISGDDAKAEGCDPWPNAAKAKGWTPNHAYRCSFMVLWDSINEERGFSFFSNPYVWALTFKKL